MTIESPHHPKRVAPSKWRAVFAPPLGKDSRPTTSVSAMAVPALRIASEIGDIDDTIKHSQVTNKSELMKNTFLREFAAVEGMPGLYQTLAQRQVAFHYVSGSPWQLYQPLTAFMAAAGFPQGTFHLKFVRLWDSSGFQILSPQQETKTAAITPLLNAFPDRRFILVGDSGEQDPEIYGQIAREHADQIAGVFIRNVTDANPADERFQKAFESVPADQWRLFQDVSEMEAEVVRLVK